MTIKNIRLVGLDLDGTVFNEAKEKKLHRLSGKLLKKPLKEALRLYRPPAVLSAACQRRLYQFLVYVMH